MVQLAQNFDATQVEPSQEFKPLPPGDYTALIENSEIKPTKAGTGTLLVFTFQIVDGQYSGRLLFDNLCIEHPNAQTVTIAQSNLSAICHAVGQLSVNDSAELHNKPMTIVVGLQKNDNTRNEIKAYKSLNGGAEPAPAQQAAPVQQVAQQQAATTGTNAPAQGESPWGGK